MSITVARQELLDAIDKLQFSGNTVSRRHPGEKRLDWSLPGFLGRTRIRTTFGEVPVEALRVNDPVVTTSGRVLLVRNIDRVSLDHEFLHRHPEAQPVRIIAHAFGLNLPEHDLIVSPGQDVTVASMNSVPGEMKAGEVRGNGSVIAATYGRLTYHIFDLGEPASVFAEGLQVTVPVKPQVVWDEDEEDGLDTTAARPARSATVHALKDSSERRSLISTSLARLADWNRVKAVGQR